MRVHADKKTPFSCDPCKKCFPQNGQLVTHPRIQEDPRMLEDNANCMMSTYKKSFNLNGNIY